MTAQEGVCRLAPATGSLQGGKTHDAALTAGHVHTVRAGCNDGAGCIGGVPVVSQHLRLKDPQRRLIPMPFQPGDGPRRIEGTYVTTHFHGGARPVDAQLFLVDLGGVGDTGLRLRLEDQPPGRQFIQRRHDGPGADVGQTVVQGAGGIGLEDGHDVTCTHRARVQPRFHLHDADAGLGVASLDGPLDRGSAAPARQQRGMDVQAAQPGQVQHRLRQQQAIGGHHHHVRLQGPQGCQCFFGPLIGGLTPDPALFGLISCRKTDAQRLGLKDWKIGSQCTLLDGRRQQFLTTTRRSVRLTEHGHHLVARPDEGIQRLGGKDRRAGIDDAQRPSCLDGRLAGNRGCSGGCGSRR